MNAVLADELQLWGFEGNYQIFSDGSFGFGLRLTPMDVSSWDDTRTDHLGEKLISFLNGLPDDLDLQFVLEIGKDNAGTIQDHENLGRKANDITAIMLHVSRVEALREMNGQSLLPRFQLLAFFRRPPKKSILEQPRLFSKLKTFEALSENKLAREIRDTEALANEMESAFNGLGFSATLLSERETAELIYRDWNPERNVQLSSYDPENIRSSLLFTDVSIEDTGFSLGDVRHRVLSLKILPDQTFSSMARMLGKLPLGARVLLSIHVPRQLAELEKLQTQRRLAYSMARGKRTGVSDIESEAKFQDLEGLISNMVAQGEKVFHFSLNVLLRGENEDKLNEEVTQSLTVLRELGGAEAMVETLATFDIFSESSIPNARATERVRRIKSSNLADFLPLYGPWEGHETPRLLLRTPLGSLLRFDPFARELSNFNQIVTGGSGSGKSFLTNCLLLQMLKENPKVYIVDIGGSYKKLCDNLRGQYTPFELDLPLSLNPFDLAEGEIDPSPHKIKFLVGLVEMMTRETTESGIGRLERAEIEEAIQKTYRDGNPSLSGLRSLLLEHPSSEIQRFGKILTPWCGDTPFGRIVDRKTTVALERSLVCFDLKGLEAYPDLQAVCLYLITDYVWRDVQKERERFKFLVLDECWKLMESNAGSTFIGEVFRTFRKYYASAIAISQNIDDFAKSRVSTAILPNTSLKWVLMQKGADQARLKEVLQLNDNEMELISSLHQSRGFYSQAFLMAEDRHCVVSIEPTPLEYWIATTDPKDLAAMNELKKGGFIGSERDLLVGMSRRFPQGVT